ncbi:hypothetical protein ACHAWU_005257 [Discostella pseudostelligera]|uniref:Uncharacterized protein n=1 Tax=Discostella pseudostelligera TaxID=259834 RepID=A0ABD3M3T8_9STRA
MIRALSIVYAASIVGCAATDAAGGCHPTFHSGKIYTNGEWVSASVTTVTPISYVACSSPGVGDCHTSGFSSVGGISSSNIYNFQCISDDDMCSNDGYAPGSANSENSELVWKRDCTPCSMNLKENDDLLRTDNSSMTASTISVSKSISRRLQGPTTGPSTSKPTSQPSPTTATNLPTPTTSQKPTPITSNGPSTSKPTPATTLTSQKPTSPTTSTSKPTPATTLTSQKPTTTGPSTSIPTPNPAAPVIPTTFMPTPQVGPTTASPTTSKPTRYPTDYPTFYDTYMPSRRPTRKPQYAPNPRPRHPRNHCLCPCSGSKSSKSAKNSKPSRTKAVRFTC